MQLDRRQLLTRALAAGVVTGVAPGFWRAALSAPAQPGDSPYGPLQAPDANGLMLPAGFTSRVVANSLSPVPGTDHVWHPFPDGGGCLPTEDGGWIYVSNSENPPPVDVPGGSALLAELATAAPGSPVTGGVGAIRFDRAGNIVDAYPVLTGSISNCAGGFTPWGTWLSCEEWESDGTPYAAGRVWECDPLGQRPAVLRPGLGIFKHEMATVDPVRQQVYLSEDQPEGLLYRYTPPPGTWGSGTALSGGRLEAMAVAPDGAVTWLSVSDVVDPAAPTGPLRSAVAGATPFDGGEGLLYDDGVVYLTTKGDDRVWRHDIAAQTMTVLYDSSEHVSPVLDGVDNLAVSAAHDLYVAEDGGNLEVCVITPERAVFPIARMTGGQHGFENPTPVPLVSEVTGLALSPDGNRLYFNSQRGMGLGGLPVGPGPGILYEVTGPFRGGTLARARAWGARRGRGPARRRR
ncbi:MAG TPA: alkaline phosphatase PhoX [Acidimicrobiales bacterium]|jgi:secreted PhoX family phosphatase|nr:alkaline phosphatase PhoX [Acidimicrobiales bacterium]